MSNKHTLTAVIAQWEVPIRKLSIFHILVIIVLWLLLPVGSSFAARILELTLGAEVYQVELAETTEQRRLGLMHRQYLAPRQGMLLVYSQSGDHRIWMKNMLIPLWVYWIDASHIVIDRHRVEPCMQPPCPVYSVNRASRYILELGDYDHPLAVGDRVAGITGD